MIFFKHYLAQGHFNMLYTWASDARFEMFLPMQRSESMNNENKWKERYSPFIVPNSTPCALGKETNIIGHYRKKHYAAENVSLQVTAWTLPSFIPRGSASVSHWLISLCQSETKKHVFHCFIVINQTAQGKGKEKMQVIWKMLHLDNLNWSASAALETQKRRLPQSRRRYFDAGILFHSFDWQICQHCHFSLTVSPLCSLAEISFDYLPLS